MRIHEEKELMKRKAASMMMCGLRFRKGKRSIILERSSDRLRV